MYDAKEAVLTQQQSEAKTQDNGNGSSTWAVPVLAVSGMFMFVAFIVIRSRKVGRNTRQVSLVQPAGLSDDDGVME